MNVSPFRVTPEDLAGLDRKTQVALQPLLEALNVTLGQLVQAAAGLQAFDVFVLKFTSSGAGTAYVDLTPRTVTSRPYSVVVDQIRRSDETQMTSPWSMSWSFISTGVRCLFTGLDASAQYALTVTLK